MSIETKYIPLWHSLTGIVIHMILLVIVYVSYTVTAEICYLLDLKNGEIYNH